LTATESSKSDAYPRHFLLLTHISPKRSLEKKTLNQPLKRDDGCFC
jgi:hypothetical protein